MGRIIRISESQMRMLESSDELSFVYINGNDTEKPYDALNAIDVSGNIGDKEKGNPKTSDNIASQLTPQSYCRYRRYGNVTPTNMRENIRRKSKN